MATIELRGVTRSYAGRAVLTGVDLAVEEGTCCTIVGGSGSGKSVLLKIVAGLVVPDAGEVRVFGEDVAAHDARALARLHEKTGILFQGGALFDSADVFENVAFPLREIAHLRKAEIAARVARTLARVGLTGRDRALPGELSGGMRKRLAFARAIVLEPKLLLLDEPTAGLDPLSTKKVATAIASATRELGATSLVVTHDLATAFSIADRIAFLDGGRIALHGPPGAILESREPRVERFFRTYRALVAEAEGGGAQSG